MRPDSPGYWATRQLDSFATDAPEETGTLPSNTRRRQVAAERRLRSRFAKADRRVQARIPAPNSLQQLWQQHKYSVLARDERGYRETGPAVAQGRIEFEALARKLNDWLCEPPGPGGLLNAVEHMWGHVSGRAERMRADIGDEPFVLLDEVGREAVRQDNRYLLEQTALTELFGWHDG